MTETESAYETVQPGSVAPAAPAPSLSPPRVFEKLAVVMAAGDPAWPRVETVLRPHLRSGRMAVSLWPVSGGTAADVSRDLAAVLDALFGLVWDDAADSVLILGARLFPAGTGLFLDADVRERLRTFPAPVLIAGPVRDDPAFAAPSHEGMRTPEQAAACIAATVARYPTLLERAAGRKNKQ